jgi:hypothetical protein
MRMMEELHGAGHFGKQIRLLQMCKKTMEQTAMIENETKFMTSSVWGWETTSVGPSSMPGSERG